MNFFVLQYFLVSAVVVVSSFLILWLLCLIPKEGCELTILNECTALHAEIAYSHLCSVASMFVVVDPFGSHRFIDDLRLSKLSIVLTACFMPCFKTVAVTVVLVVLALVSFATSGAARHWWAPGCTGPAPPCVV